MNHCSNLLPHCTCHLKLVARVRSFCGLAGELRSSSDRHWTFADTGQTKTLRIIMAFRKIHFVICTTPAGGGLGAVRWDLWLGKTIEKYWVGKFRKASPARYRSKLTYEASNNLGRGTDLCQLPRCDPGRLSRSATGPALGKVQVLTSRLLRNSHGLIVAHGAVLVRLMNPLIVCDRYRFVRLGLRISFPITQDLVLFAIAILGHLRSALFAGFAVVV